MSDQLEMFLPYLQGLPEPECPEGYEVRTFRPRDEAAWAHVLESSLGGGWTAEKVRARLVTQWPFHPESTFFVTYRGTPVGAATAWLRKPLEQREGYVHMVAVRPEHRGKRLGHLLTLLTLKRFREMGMTCARLHTDDWRLPAIRIYLGIGFTPVIVNESHRERWLAVLQELGEEQDALYKAIKERSGAFAGD